MQVCPLFAHLVCLYTCEMHRRAFPPFPLCVLRFLVIAGSLSILHVTLRLKCPTSHFDKPNTQFSAFPPSTAQSCAAPPGVAVRWRRQACRNPTILYSSARDSRAFWATYKENNKDLGHPSQLQHPQTMHRQQAQRLSSQRVDDQAMRRGVTTPKQTATPN